MRDLDVIAYAGRDLWSDAINIGTWGIPRWGASHVGLYFQGEIWEALSQGVVTNRLAKRVSDYPGRMWRYPLYRDLYSHEKERAREILVAYHNRPYDWDCWLSMGLFGLLATRESLVKLFCSELVAVVMAKVGVHVTNNASKWSPNRLIRHLRLEGVLKKPLRLK